MIQIAQRAAHYIVSEIAEKKISRECAIGGEKFWRVKRP